MFKRRVISTCAICTALIIGVVIDNFTGFDKGYFAISVAALLAGYWMIEFLLDLIYYHFFYDDEFKMYVAEKINKTQLTYDEIMAKEKYYLKEFKKKRKGKFSLYVKFFFAMGLFIFLVVCLFI